MITSTKRVIFKHDPYTDEYISTKVSVWNPTVANLTLMALGSSAPEILLNVIETVQTLGSKPGELGPSTIVGSASFNFLIISGISIYAVNEGNDTRDDEERIQAGTPKGVKKVADTGVFAITTIWSIIAYVWLYVVLLDGIVKEWEAYLTLGFFFFLIIMAYIADKIRSKTIQDREDKKYGLNDGAVTAHSPANFNDVRTMNAIDFYNKLLPIEAGKPAKKEDEAVTNEMKMFLQVEFGTTKVSEVPKEKLKELLEGPALIERINHRKAVGVSYKKEAIQKYQVLRRENKSANLLADHQKNPLFGFSCLHYSVSEAAGALRIKILNKTKAAGKVGVRTVDGEAKKDEDYIPIDQVVNFKSGQAEAEVKVKILDDDEWEPDEDFYVELYDDESKKLPGDDTRTRVTILDDDKPGVLVFEEKKSLRHPANVRECVVVVNRIQGTDGAISVKYKTVQMDNTAQTATPGVDYEPREGILNFAHQESSKQIVIPILAHPDAPDDEIRDEIFGVKLYDPLPAAVKVSRKDVCVIEICKDAEQKAQDEALNQLLEKIQREEEITWGQQFKQACMLHDSRAEDGTIERVSGLDAVIQFFSIGWGVLFACCPPPHWGGGVPCFLAAISFVGGLTAIVGEIAGVMGCVMGLKPGVTAITFVAIGTSLPDTFASMKAARESNDADAAVGNITGSNSVNVFLGLGLPWTIAVIYSKNNNEEYKVPAKGLDLSVVLFLSCCLVGIGILIFRRCTVKGELGGSHTGRVVSACVFFSLWLFYIVMSTLGQYGFISISSEEDTA